MSTSTFQILPPVQPAKPSIYTPAPCADLTYTVRSKKAPSIQLSWPLPAHPNQCLPLVSPNSCFWAPASTTSLWQKPQAILNKLSPKLPVLLHGSPLSQLQPVTVLLQGLDAVPDLAPHFPQLEERQVPLGLLNWNKDIHNCQRTTPLRLTTSCLATSLALLRF